MIQVKLYKVIFCYTKLYALLYKVIHKVIQLYIMYIWLDP